MKVRVAAVTALLLALLDGGLLIAKAAVPSVLPDSWTAAEDAADRATEVSIAARTFALTFLTYDHRTMEQDARTLKALTTGSFAEEFEANQDRLTELARSQQAVSSGDVLRVGIGTLSEDGAVVDVAATKVEEFGVAVQDEAEEKTTTATRQLYLRITLERVDSRWLVAGLSIGRVA